ncbi:MAG: toxic anion resistance protein [Thiotrichaceae bacterium]|nr:toxic anion resistance protein [Thiotrichaceae bacterium]
MMPENQITTTTKVGEEILDTVLKKTKISHDIVSYSEANSDDKTVITSLVEQINMDDRNSILFFGADAQEDMSTISEEMLNGVKNKDLGNASKSLNDIVVAIKGFDIDELNPNKKVGFFSKLFGKAKPVVAFIAKYDDIKEQITIITDDLEDHKGLLLHDIISLDKLYEANLEYFHSLEHYIAAGEEKLSQINKNILPKMMAEADTENKDVLLTQKLRDTRSSRDDLDRRIHDLRLTRQVAMQSLPSIRMIQENDKSLITKINSTLINTVPLWKNQLAQALTIFRMSAAADSVKSATDLTNDLLESNAENLQQGNLEVRKQIERGIFDIESVRKANDSIITSINDSLQIAEEGRVARHRAVTELTEMETDLHEALISAKARAEEQAEQVELK